MKLTPAKIKEAATWVEQHGLFPQACGAAVKEFCEFLGIKDTTYRRWLEKVDFVDAITRARAEFADRTVREVENALVRAALGVDYEKTKEKGRAFDEVVKEYDPVTGNLIRETKTKKMVTVEATRERVYYPPDVKAAQFVLTNLAPDKWQDKRKNDVDLSLNAEEPPTIIFGTQEEEPKEE